MRVAVYEVTTGEILRVVVCPEAAVGRQAGDGEAVLECGPDVSDATHRVVDGEVAPLP